MRDDEMLAVWGLVKKYQKLLVERVGDGCDVRENFRLFLAQSRLKVDHVHWHLIPRANKDELYAKSQMGEGSIFGDLTSGELNGIKAVLAS